MKIVICGALCGCHFEGRVPVLNCILLLSYIALLHRWTTSRSMTYIIIPVPIDLLAGSKGPTRVQYSFEIQSLPQGWKFTDTHA